jgi:hypothetical protein
MSDDNALPKKAAKPDSTPSPITQPDHIAPDPKTTPTPDAAPNLELPPRSPTASGVSSFLSPLFTEMAGCMEIDFIDDRLEGHRPMDLRWVPIVLTNIFDSKITQTRKQYYLKFFLRFVSIIIMMINCDDPREYAEVLDDLVPDVDTFTTEAVFASLLSELSPCLIIKDSRYVFYVFHWYDDNLFQPGEAGVAACVYETLAKYLAQFVKPPNDH